MAIKRSYEEVNQKIKDGKAVVMTAEEISAMAKELSPDEIAKKVDVVTTATFGAMCSSGVFLNFGHASPPIKMKRVWLNNVLAYAGIAAVDAYLGATEISEHDEKYGGAHVIEQLLKGDKIRLKAYADATDCYPRKEIESEISLDSINEAIMFNPRNAYQNYNVAINTTDKTKHTYMGTLLPNSGNVTYSTSGELSPLLNDPEFRVIGIGTRILLGGAPGYVAWNGTQFTTSKPKNNAGVPISNAATLSVVGDLKKMSANYIKAAYFEKYGVSMFVGIGIPIPILDEDIARYVSIRNEQIETTIMDYGKHPVAAVGKTNYSELQSGHIRLNGKKIRAAPVSSLYKAREIAENLKKMITGGGFFLSAPVEHLAPKGPLNSLR
jgi:uncharacterized protein (DUF39 family)